MIYKIRLGSHVKKYLKKVKEKPLRKKIIDAIYDEIAIDPYSFNTKVGDLSGIHSYEFKYKGISYRIAYTIKDDELIISVILVGTHENFYQELKRINK